MRTIEVKTADGIVIPIQFHREGYKCWHVMLPAHVDVPPLQMDWQTKGDYSYRGPKDECVLATSSLGRGMEVIAEYIGQTEF